MQLTKRIAKLCYWFGTSLLLVVALVTMALSAAGVETLRPFVTTVEISVLIAVLSFAAGILVWTSYFARLRTLPVRASIPRKYVGLVFVYITVAAISYFTN